ncbi:hypothetical protein SAMN02745751_01704 [Dethiosulfatibacter aminovorans DSM 17477]|uniref:Uncharacterized protein n=1 Tax=Dethiosulfatibacter aminovorans DSM 17477 TaxID=1121476 RepID=A0A1M6GDB2_9FIRM|nr:hypothetical protein [Dethiosulfatibacter aminovorans]SHJ07927.1 hypothetical protein SAMN02745751_01704 [Dethiosulfatibacter aminovorans DSM 17477]
MITAYLEGIPGFYENEDIEIRYCIFNNEEEVCRKSMYMEYKKPVLVGLYALSEICKDLKEYAEDDITIKINDPVLLEQINGTTTTKNRDILKMAETTRTRMRRVNKTIEVVDVSTDRQELLKWNEILKF